MRPFLTLPALSLVALLAACGASSTQPPMSTSGAGGGNLAPQSPNSLPLGSSTDQPLTSPTGIVGQTNVGGAPTARAGTPSTAYVDGAAPPPRRRVIRRRRRVVRRPAAAATARPATPSVTATPVPTTPSTTVAPGMPAPGSPAPSTTR